MKKYAEILVDFGYACRYYGNYPFTLMLVTKDAEVISERIGEVCDPFADTLEGRRQFEAIYNYLLGVDVKELMTKDIEKRMKL